MSLDITQWDRFLASFFDLAVMQKYLPDIVDGFLLTCHLAILIVISGLALGLILAVIRAYEFWLTSWLIVVFADVMRALPPLVFILLLYFGLPGVGLNLSGYAATYVTLTLVLAAFSEENFSRGHPGDAEGSMGGCALYRSRVRPIAGLCDHAPGDPHDGAAAYQPHHRHRKEYGARNGRRRW